MKKSHRRLRFRGNEYIFVQGAIMTPEAYANFDDSYAHLFDDGKIKRYGEVIGTVEDIEWLEGEDNTEPSERAYVKALAYMMYVKALAYMMMGGFDESGGRGH